MKVTGACQCGDITIEGEVDPETVRICHCADCQKNSGSAFRLNVPISGETFRMVGTPATYIKTTAESGNPRLQAFCSRCGTSIYTTTPGEGLQTSYMTRVGILDQRDKLSPRRQIWFGSALAWVVRIGALPKIEAQN
jgi:hypothetical protein